MNIYYLTAGLAIGLFTLPWVFWVLSEIRTRRFERLQREWLVYLKSGSAYEAEDVIERVERRQKGPVSRALAKMKRKGDSLSEEGPDMRTRVEQDFRKEYGIDEPA